MRWQGPGPNLLLLTDLARRVNLTLPLSSSGNGSLSGGAIAGIVIGSLAGFILLSGGQLSRGSERSLIDKERWTRGLSPGPKVGYLVRSTYLGVPKQGKLQQPGAGARVKSAAAEQSELKVNPN